MPSTASTRVVGRRPLAIGLVLAPVVRCRSPSCGGSSPSGDPGTGGSNASGTAGSGPGLRARPVSRARPARQERLATPAAPAPERPALAATGTAGSAGAGTSGAAGRGGTTGNGAATGTAGRRPGRHRRDRRRRPRRHHRRGRQRRHRHRGRQRRNRRARPAPGPPPTCTVAAGPRCEGAQALTPYPFGCTFAWGHQNPSGSGSLSSYNYLQMVAYWIESGIRSDGTFPSCTRLHAGSRAASPARTWSPSITRT